MSLFKKKKSYEDENYEPFEFIFEDELPANSTKLQHSPNALTSEEIINQTEDIRINNNATGALDALKKRLSAANIEDDLQEDENSKAEENEETATLLENEVLTEQETQKAETKKETEPQNTNEQKHSTLLDKCKPFLVDSDGNADVIESEPLYQLQSVADILKSESEKVIEKLSQNYDISFDDLGHTKAVTQNETESDKTKPEPKKEIKITSYESPKTKDNAPKVISDIDYTEIPEAPHSPLSFEPDATITFTPVSSGKSKETKIKVSTHTKSIDLTNELMKLPETEAEISDDGVKLEQDDFEDFVPETEYVSKEDVKKLKLKFFKSKRTAFLVSTFTVFITLILGFAKLPFMFNILLSYTKISMIVCGVLTLISVLLNADMFASFTKIFSKNSLPDVSISLSSIFTIAFFVSGIIRGEIMLDLLLMLSIALSARSITKFFKSSYMLSNFQQISTPVLKKAVKLINDPAITFAMAKNAIEGDVLIAAAQKTNQISNFMKYSTYGAFLGGRLPIITVFSLILSLISGFAGAAYFGGAYYGFYAAAAIQLLTSLPSVFLIDTLPLYRASKRLNKIGAMIMGKIGAEHLEMANAVVLSSNDLFPKGTVTLHQMKVLSENSLDDTLVRAASLTEYMSSTLAPIFKEIANSGDIKVLPDADTVKYEDRMGVSGWVDNRLLFIGNRALMEAHGIAVPDLEVDRKILRQGFFPVYVATGDKACALLIIQYSVEKQIAAELRNLSKIGVTLLINNTDPNLSEAMISDYFGLFDDSVKVMSAAGCHMYKNTVVPANVTSAPAAYKGSSLALAKIMNCANKIKLSNTLLTVFYIISAVLGVIIFAYTSFGGSGEMLSSSTLLIYGIITSVLTYLIYLTQRP